MVIMILVIFFAQLLLQLFQLLQPFGVFLDLRLDGLGLRLLGGILFGLTHQHAHLLGKAVAGGAQVAGLGDGRACSAGPAPAPRPPAAVCRPGISSDVFSLRRRDFL
jgi:hypothetical protein